MRLKFTLAAAVALVALFCAKKEAAVPQAAPAERPQIAQSPPPPPAGKVEDPSVVADCQKAQQILDDWSGDSSQLREAGKLLMGVIARDRDYAPAYVALSRLERKAVQNSESNSEGLQRSRKFADHALKLDPKSGEAYAASAWTSVAFRDWDSATAAADQAEQLGARPLDVKAIRAEIAYNQNDLKKALTLTKEIVGAPDATRKDRTSAYDLMVDIYNRVGAVDEADQVYREQLKVDPNRAWAHGNYAAFLLRRGRVDDAIAQAERAVKLMPYPMGFMTLAQAYIAKANELWDAKQYDASAACIDKTASIVGGNGNAEVYYRLGLFYERASKRTGDPSLLARASASYQQALTLNPSHAAARQAVERLAQ